MPSPKKQQDATNQVLSVAHMSRPSRVLLRGLVSTHAEAAPTAQWQTEPDRASFELYSGLAGFGSGN